MKCDLCKKNDACHLAIASNVVFCNECAIECPRCKRDEPELIDGYCHCCHWEEQWELSRLYAETVNLTGATVVYINMDEEMIVLEKDGDKFVNYDDELSFRLVLEDEWEEK